MKIKLENIGKIKSAEVELNGITVIAGENDTGKSTVGKALFCVTNGFSNLGDRFKAEKKIIIQGKLKNLTSFSPNSFLDITKCLHLAEDFVENSNIYLRNTSSLEEKSLKEFQIEPDLTNNAFITNIIDDVIKILEIEDNDFLYTFLSHKFYLEFHGQLSRFGENNCIVELYSNNSNFSIKMNGSNIEKIKDFDKEFFFKNSIYIDDINIFNEFGKPYYEIRKEFGNLSRKEYLFSCLNYSPNINIVSDILNQKKFRKILEKVNLVSPGDIEIDRMFRTFFYNDKTSESQAININNLSTGIKSFSIIKTLIKNGFLSDGGFLILDEPEINLHPKWQLVYAEVLVLLQKTFDLRILLNTHSPYFLKAIEDYSEYHKINDKCKFYLASNEENYSNIVDVTGDVEKIYDILAEPFQTLIDVRYADDD